MENARQIAQVRQYVDQKSSEIMTTTDQKVGDQEATIQQIQKVQTDTSNNLNSMWAVKLQQMQDGLAYIAGISALRTPPTACRVRCCWRQTGLR